MKVSRGILGTVVWLLAAGTALAAGKGAPSLGIADGVAALKLLATTGIQAAMAPAPKADGAQSALQVRFQKAGSERRMLALQAPVQGVAAETVKTLALRCRVQMTRGDAPRLALVLFGRGGNAWLQIGAEPLEPGAFQDELLPVTAPRAAGFSANPDAPFNLSQVEKVWLGLLLDGPAAGSFEISRAQFSSAAYKPSRPKRVTGSGPGVWQVGLDPAAKAEVHTANDGPQGQPCMHMDFHFPGQRHMYAIPNTPVDGGVQEGFSGLRFTYKAALPAGIPGLLVMLVERDGAQYAVEPPPAASADWTTVTLPFEHFKLGGWSKDDNDRLDPTEIAGVSIGVHGSAAGAGGDGSIAVTDVLLTP